MMTTLLHLEHYNLLRKKSMLLPKFAYVLTQSKHTGSGQTNLVWFKSLPNNYLTEPKYVHQFELKQIGIQMEHTERTIYCLNNKRFTKLGKKKISAHIAGHQNMLTVLNHRFIGYLASSSCLIFIICFPGFNPLGQARAQFNIVWQR